MKAKKIMLVSTLVTLAIWYSVWSELTTLLLNKTIGVEKIKNTYPLSKMKYILQWTKANTQPFMFMGRGRSTFIKRRCAVNNCFVTSNRDLLNNLKSFDAVLFHGPELYGQLIRLPRKRSVHQKYAFVSAESSSHYPIYYDIYDGYFNWTWTYKLDSDVYYGYIIIRDKEGNYIGPKKDMHWLKLEEMQPIGNEIKEILDRKTVAAAWFVSHCKVSSKRDEVGKLMQKELAKYNMTVDIYGPCGTKYCPRRNMKKCLRMLETDYYFYFSFENAVTEDYVTEKLLHAVQHYTIPVVYGGANYTRFMPDGSFLNVQTSKIENLVKQMVDLIKNKQKYYDFFRWTNHYSYHYGEEFPETDQICDFCSKINDNNLVKQESSIQNFRMWWNQNAQITYDVYN